ncbi:type II toxin-antitoxin system RelB family antitoxin [Enterococcus sp. RIT-PI-f]|uniref:type II toxin-antitoxin system RelB family antitoxin n=1 Tax=Enterococcus sp. RIT-PI-f TaxID=1690244 RepID=UPI0006BA039C|nr:DUF6290 family protein [Enterococcus sp. RIT-PI-f]KPG70550.1 translation repressor RelB [Enterococcus sp. RIT-PI-f]
MRVPTIRLNDEEEALFQNYAALTGQPLSIFMKHALTEINEDIFDVKTGSEALKKLSGETISLQDMMQAEGLSGK